MNRTPAHSVFAQYLKLTEADRIIFQTLVEGFETKAETVAPKKASAARTVAKRNAAPSANAKPATSSE